MQPPGPAITLFLSLRLRSDIDRAKILPLLIGSLPGVAVGGIFLRKAPAELISILMIGNAG